MFDRFFPSLKDRVQLEEIFDRNKFDLGKRPIIWAVEKDGFRYVEMDLGAKKKVGGRVLDCHIDLGYFIKKSNLYVTILGSYDVVIDMDWLESHDAILKCNMKWLILTDDEGQR
jgi:hypothetical protein